MSKFFEQKYLIWILVVFLFLPYFALLFLGLNSNADTFSYLANTVLLTYTKNSLILVVNVVFIACFLGIFLAYITSFCDFYGRKFFTLFLILPLAMPSYIVAAIYSEIFDISGPIANFLKSFTSLNSKEIYQLLDIKNIFGASLILGFLLFPYVFLITKVAFLNKNKNLILSAKLFGKSNFTIFMKIILPLSKPAIVSGSILVAMETLSDFATVNYFAVQTLTSAVYDTWLEYYDIFASAKISLIIILFVVILFFIQSIQSKSIASDTLNLKNIPLIKPKKHIQILLFCFCFFVLAISFLIPFVCIFLNTILTFEFIHLKSAFFYSMNSFYVAFFSSFFTLIFAIIFTFYSRFSRDLLRKLPKSILRFGYACPPTVIALCLIISLSFLDKLINFFTLYFFDFEVGLVLSASIFALVFAYICRFLAIAINNLDAGFKKIPKNLDLATALFKKTGFCAHLKIFSPLLKKSYLVAFILVFLEALKELPASLLLRPFAFENLATFTYSHVIDENIEFASFYALLIIIFGLIALLFSFKSLNRS